MGFPSTIYGAEKDTYETGAIQLYPIGQRLELPDGSIFHYAEKGAGAGVANKNQQSSIPVANWTNVDLTTALAVGATQVQFKDAGTAFVVNEAAGGHVAVEETGDLGHIYRIKSNTATATNVTIMQFEDGVTAQKVVTANATTFVKNPWKDFIIAPATAPTSGPCGVPRVIIAANAFGWLQTQGVASCLIETDTTGGALAVGDKARAANEVAGALSVHEETTVDQRQPILAICLVTRTTAEFGPVFLIIE